MSAPLVAVNSELVAVAWALSLPGMPVGGVATELPELAAWASSGFVTIDTIAGGSPDVDTGVLRRPVVQYSCWAARPESSRRPPWGRAFELAELLVRCCEASSEHYAKVVTIRAPFEQATVRDARAFSEPRRFPSPDPAGHARVTLDVQLTWTRLTTPEVHT